MKNIFQLDNHAVLSRKPIELVPVKQYRNYPEGSIPYLAISEINKSAMTNLISQAEILRYNRNEGFILEGNEPTDLLIIFSGKVEVFIYEKRVKKSANFKLNELSLRSNFNTEIIILTIEPGFVSLFTSENSGIAMISERIFYKWLTKYKSEKFKRFLYM